jgi:hypothetical protein
MLGPELRHFSFSRDIFIPRDPEPGRVTPGRDPGQTAISPTIRRWHNCRESFGLGGQSAGREKWRKAGV